MSDKIPFPAYFNLESLKCTELRYGENPHQQGFFYVEKNPPSGSIAGAAQLQGKELSFNNIVDASTAIECAFDFAKPVCVIVKHANPCGVAVRSTLWIAYDRAYLCNPTSAFGGIIAFNRSLDEGTATTILERQFVEVIIAPEVEPKALRVLKTKPDIRVLETGYPRAGAWSGLDIKSVPGGLLVQERDITVVTADQLRCMTKRRPTEAELNDLLFAWQVVKWVKSNAIVFAYGGRTIGVGAGQMNRIESVRLAGKQTSIADPNGKLRQRVMASDAFIPFADNISEAASYGITAVIQPGGSVRDQEVIDAADEYGMAMVFTGIRHFRH